VYGLAQLLGYFKHIDDLRLNERLDAIEARLDGGVAPTSWTEAVS